jgi:hypothetical protein
MKKSIVALWLIGQSFVSLAQKDQPVTPFPISMDTITGLITYQGVVEVAGVKEDELYHRINDWFHSYYKNPNEVIRENDSIKFSITGKPRFRLLTPADKEGEKMVEGTSVVQYTITVAARNGRFRYELTAFNWKQLSYYPCERWLDTKASSYQPVYNDYLEQVEKNSRETVSSLKNAVMKAKAVRDKDNW